MLSHSKLKDSFAYARCKVKFTNFGLEISFPQAFQMEGVRGMVVVVFYLPFLQELDIWS